MQVECSHTRSALKYSVYINLFCFSVPERAGEINWYLIESWNKDFVFVCLFIYFWGQTGMHNVIRAIKVLCPRLHESLFRTLWDDGIIDLSVPHTRKRTQRSRKNTLKPQCWAFWGLNTVCAGRDVWPLLLMGRSVLIETLIWGNGGMV